MATRTTGTNTARSGKKAPATRHAPKRGAHESTRSRSAGAPARVASTDAVVGVSVRMYRVGFGDFFLVGVPTPRGKRDKEYILIDCGVFKGTSGKGDIGSIGAAVDNLASVTGGELALVIMTHRHADHIIGFSRCKAQFQKMKVGAVWMPVWENEYEAKAAKFQASLTGLALKLDAHLALSADTNKDPTFLAARDMLYNATGAGSLAAAAGGGTNAASLDLLKKGFGVTPSYYAAGDTPKIPDVLAEAGTSAKILGPPPVADMDLMKMMDLTKGVGQYLDAEGGAEDDSDPLNAFLDEEWKVGPEAYHPEAFAEWKRAGDDKGDAAAARVRMEKALAAAQPTSYYAAAKTLDSFLNNQSLVVLFEIAGKKLLFVGDAQAGNWEHWLYHTDSPDKAPSGALSSDGASILESIDFYKVGHHGSTNATPKAAVAAMRKGIVAMCSTQADVYGTEAKGTEVPRIPLLTALGAQCDLVRSDQVPITVGGNAIPAAKETTPLPAKTAKRVSVGTCWVDYEL